MCYSHNVRCSFPPRFMCCVCNVLVCVSRPLCIPQVTEVSHDWCAKAPSPRKWKLIAKQASCEECGWKISYTRGSPQIMTEDGAHQVKGKKHGMYGNELMTQHMRNTSPLVGCDSLANLDRTSKLVVLLGNLTVCGQCNTHVVRCSFPPGFMLVFDEFRVLCLCCDVLVFSGLLVCPNNVHFPRFPRSSSPSLSLSPLLPLSPLALPNPTPRLEQSRDDESSTKVETHTACYERCDGPVLMRDPSPSRVTPKS